MRDRSLSLFFLVLPLLAAACGDDGGSTSPTGTDGDTGTMPLTSAEASPVMESYAALVFAGYGASIDGANEMQTAIDALIAVPDDAALQAAKQAWLAAREPYGQTEAFRFYGGPIDDDDGPEGQLNAWPMDESYVDYVEGVPDGGIVNDTTVEITAEMLASLNEVGGEANVATGYHAIEFLLWGQDSSPDGPGARPVDDFVDGSAAPNPDRRRVYLGTVTQLLLDDLEAVASEWDPDVSGNYREAFLALPPQEGIQNIMRGIGALSGAELAEERMNVALETKLQEDEHSCFSDNTHNDVLYNFLSIKNVYLGTDGAVMGPGIDTLVEARDSALASEITAKLAETEMLVRAIPEPFDQAILGAVDDPGPAAVEAAVTSLRELSDLFVAAAATMDITLNTALE